VRFGKNASMSFEIAWAANTEDESYIEFLGTKGGIKVFNSKNPRLLTEFNGNIANVELLIPEAGNAFHIQAKKFIEACRGERPSEVPGKQGLVNMKLIDAIYESGVKSKEITIK
jgi:predicted dehydrogenase